MKSALAFHARPVLDGRSVKYESWEAAPGAGAHSQLLLFPDQATPTRIQPDHNEWRFYRLPVLWPDLFSRALLGRH